MAESASHEGDSSIIVSLSEAAMHMYAAAIDALPFLEDKKFPQARGGRSVRNAEAARSADGSQLYATRIDAKLSAQEVANGAGLSAELLDELEAGATPTDEEAVKIKDAIAALGGVPGIEQYEQPEHHEAEHEDQEPHVNGWDESLVGDHAG